MCNWLWTTYERGTKSVISARLLAREVRGVYLISSRLTRVVGVVDSGCAGPAAAEAVIDSAWPLSVSPKGKMGAVPESTAIVCSSLENEAAEAVTRYSPRGIASKWNSPLASVCEV